MNELLIVTIFALLGWLIWSWRKSVNQAEQLARRLDLIGTDLRQLKRATEGPNSLAPAALPLTPKSTTAAPTPASALDAVPRPASPPPVTSELLAAHATSLAASPVAPIEPRTERTEETQGTREGPPPITNPSAEPEPMNLERFLGVNLFAWIGGLALFLGVAFFIKYSFERGWISPTLRVLSGIFVGLGLTGGGLLIPRPRHAVTAQTLCAAGGLILYASLFAAHSFYNLIGSWVAFAGMSLVTAMMFWLAARLEARFVAVLGLAGGFLTPPLLSTGVDRPLGLFGYIGLLDLGLIAVALRQRWTQLVLLAAFGTVLMQIGWVIRFFAPAKILIAMGIFLEFVVMFLAAIALAQRSKRNDFWTSAAFLLVPASAFGFAFYLLLSRTTVPTPALLFTYVFIVDIAVLLAVWIRLELRPALAAASGAVFVLLLIWTGSYLTETTLKIGLICYLTFAVLHTVFPFALQRAQPTATPQGWIHFHAPLALVLVLIPLMKLSTASLFVWPVVLLIDALAIALAIATSSLLTIFAVLVLTTVASALWIFQRPPDLQEIPALLVIVGGFSFFFIAAAVFAGKRAALRDSQPGTGALNTYSQMAALSAAFPFFLLILVAARLPLENPSSIFCLAGLLAAILLACVRLFRADAVAVVAGCSILALEYFWHWRHFQPSHSGLALCWHAAFAFLFFLFPFVFPRVLRERPMPWRVAALSWPAHFWLVYHIIEVTYPRFEMGLVPAVLAVPCFLGFLWLRRTASQESAQRNLQLAWFAGATLFFVTLTIPIQFERQWITLSWALEGAALFWLFRRVPHPGLQNLGCALLVISFARLALNPAVLVDYPQKTGSIFNWYLYTYGIVTGCLLASAGMALSTRSRVRNIPIAPVLFTLGTILAFLLLNIEIASYFSPGNRVVFHFSGSFAQDMTYSLAWSLFASTLLGIGFRCRNAATRYAGMGLLVVTLLKLFLHDLWRLGGLYRIGSLIGLAVVLILVSFVYQRFLAVRTGER